MSCAVIRTLLPCLRTEPSRRFATPNVSAMVRRSWFLPLKENDDVRPATFRPFTRASAFRISSAMPSEKYSWSFDGLKSANANTAMDGVAAVPAAGARGAGFRTKRYQTTPGAAASAPMLTRTTARRAPRKPVVGSVRSMRPALTSKIQARPTTMGKPIASAATTYDSTASGQWNPCMIGSTIWSTANAAMP